MTCVTPKLADSLTLYDDFNVADIDAGKWENTEQIVEEPIVPINGPLPVTLTKIGETDGEWFIWYIDAPNPGTNTDLAVDVTINPEMDASGVVMMNGQWFNDGSSSGAGDQTGDIRGGIGIYPTEVDYWISRCSDASCSTWSDLTSGILDNSTNNINTPRTIRTQYDGNATFTFSLDGSPAIENLSPGITRGGPAVGNWVQIVGMGAFLVAGQQKTLSANIDNVMVDGILYDDFQTADGPIGQMFQQHLVRKIQNGELVSQVGGNDTSVSNFLIFQNANSINAIAAEVTVLDYQATGGGPMATFGGFFYNDGTAGAVPGSRTGDIHADIDITNQEVLFRVGRNTGTGTPVSLIVPGSDPLGTAGIGTPHTLFIQWDGALFTFQLDSELPQTFDPVAAGAPVANSLPNGGAFKRIGTRTPLSSGESGFFSATFDDVRTGN